MMEVLYDAFYLESQTFGMTRASCNLLRATAEVFASQRPGDRFALANFSGRALPGFEIPGVTIRRIRVRPRLAMYAAVYVPFCSPIHHLGSRPDAVFWSNLYYFGKDVAGIRQTVFVHDLRSLRLSGDLLFEGTVDDQGRRAKTAAEPLPDRDAVRLDEERRRRAGRHRAGPHSRRAARHRPIVSGHRRPRPARRGRGAARRGREAFHLLRGRVPQAQELAHAAARIPPICGTAAGKRCSWCWPAIIPRTWSRFSRKPSTTRPIAPRSVTSALSPTTTWSCSTTWPFAWPFPRGTRDSGCRSPRRWRAAARWRRPARPRCPKSAAARRSCWIRPTSARVDRRPGHDRRRRRPARQLRQKGLARAGELNWRKTAEKILSLLA